METITLPDDITVFYVTAASFPAGIADAHQRIHALVPFSGDRRYFGISRPENGEIVYRAAAEERHPGEAEQYHCETLVLKEGPYRCITIQDYMQHIQQIGEAFEELLAYADIDPQGYCVEWYVNDREVKCMVRTME